MKPKSDQGARADPTCKGDVYQEFAKSGYAEQQDLDGAAHMPVAMPVASGNPDQIGASPIRWTWWVGAAAISVGLWWVIAQISYAL